jgi:site-specific recombinase XerD
VKLQEAGELLLIESASRRLSPRTVEYYRDRLATAVRTVGDKSITSITSVDPRKVFVECSERSGPNNYRFLTRLFNFLINEEVIKHNPMEKARAPKIEQRVIQPHSLDGIQTLFRTAKVNPRSHFIRLRDAAIFALLVGTGIRREELCNLKDEDVKLAEGVMLIRSKGRKQRLVPIPIHLRKMMARYQSVRKAKTAKLRHSFATHFMANDGADVLSFQPICGWSTLAMATRYSHATMPKLQRSMDSFSPSCE